MDDTEADTEADKASRALASQALAEGDPNGWFERLYSLAARGEAQVPWDRDQPTVRVVEWFGTSAPGSLGRRALVVGCGYGRDAEYLAGQGFEVVAFDLSETAIATAGERYPASTVQYVAADLFDPPAEWAGSFDVVVESTTVQALPIPMHAEAIRAISDFVAPGGTLLVVAFAREVTTDPEGPPWPLTRSEIGAFAGHGLTLVELEDLQADDPEDRRWRAEFRRGQGR